MYARRPQMLQPLTNRTSTNVKFKLADMKQMVFDDMKWIVARDTLI